MRTQGQVNKPMFDWTESDIGAASLDCVYGSYVVIVYVDRRAFSRVSESFSDARRYYESAAALIAGTAQAIG